MADIDTYLYANGALRLTRHGDRAGGTCLVREFEDGSTIQIDVPDALTSELRSELENELAQTDDPGAVFASMLGLF